MTTWQPLEIASTGMVTSVGMNSAAACAAIRVGLANPTVTDFSAAGAAPIVGHAVMLEEPWRGREKLARMATLSIEECLAVMPSDHWSEIPLLLCVAETTRPGRLSGIDDMLTLELQRLLRVSFAAQSAVIPRGRVSIGVALDRAQRLIYGGGVDAVLIAATDSLLIWPTLRVLGERGRLLADDNSNGFIPGEASVALLVRKPAAGAQLVCTGMGFGIEEASLDSGEPLRADGLTRAIKGSLATAGVELHDLDFRITDISGEQYFFKEAALAFGRALRARKERFGLWHPAECIGETGAVAGLACFAVALAASRKGYAPGRGVLLHTSGDGTERAAFVAVGA